MPTITDVQTVPRPRARRFGVRQDVPMILGANRFECKRFAVRTSVSTAAHGHANVCRLCQAWERAPPNRVCVAGRGAHLRYWLSPERQRAKGKLSCFQPCHVREGFLLLPAPKGKQKVGGLRGVFGFSLPGSQVPCVSRQWLASAPRYAAGSHQFPPLHGLFAAATELQVSAKVPQCPRAS